MGKVNRSPLCGLLAGAALGLATPALAHDQSPPPEVYPLYPAGTLAIPADALPETLDGGRVRNVTVPALTVFHPTAGADAHVAIIIAPGGGFEHLSYVNEGTAVASRLAELGVTAVVLKYRLARSLPHSPQPPITAPRPQLSLPHNADAQNSSPAARNAMADGDAAVAFVRAHAAGLHVSAKRIGFLGFSAGAVIALHVALNPDAAARPDFVAAIYGVMPSDAVVPAAAPPLFLALAADDRLVDPSASLAAFAAWRAAGNEAELHVFQSGGHGFGITAQNTTSDHWIDAYKWWLEARGIMRRF